MGEILDIFYYPPDELFKHTVLDPTTIPERERLFGRPPTPEEAEIALRNREMTARLTWKPYMFNPRLPHFLPRVTTPTLLLWGREDGIVPVICGEQYRRLLPERHAAGARALRPPAPDREAGRVRGAGARLPPEGVR